jgi:hypothetical protein
MMFWNASQAFLALLPVMDLKPHHLVIALRNANNPLPKEFMNNFVPS